MVYPRPYSLSLSGTFTLHPIYPIFYLLERGTIVVAGLAFRDQGSGLREKPALSSLAV